MYYEKVAFLSQNLQDVPKIFAVNMVCVFVYVVAKNIFYSKKTTFNTYNNVEKVKITKFILEENKNL